MVTFIIIVVLLIAMALAATRWSFDSREKIGSPEWERRVSEGANASVSAPCVCEVDPLL
jgi:hypothetical protein